MSDAVYDRRTTLGSSDISSILGISKWGDAWDVWLEKTGRTTPEAGFSGDQAAGNMMEDAVAREMGKRMDLIFEPGAKLSEAPSIGPEPWMSARTDFYGRVWKGRSWKCGLEVKTLRAFDNDEWGPDGSSLFPPDKAAQIVWQQAVDNAYPETVLAAWAWSSYELRTYTVQRDKAVEKLLVEQMRDWWFEHVEKDVPPPGRGPVARAWRACSRLRRRRPTGTRLPSSCGSSTSTSTRTPSRRLPGPRSPRSATSSRPPSALTTGFSARTAARSLSATPTARASA